MNEELWLDTHSRNAIHSAGALESGRCYRVTVQGTYSPWSDASKKGHGWEPAAMWPTPGREDRRTACDPEFMFLMRGPEHEESSPQPMTSVQVSLDGGKTWAHPATRDAYNTDHRYTYELLGGGAPIIVRLTDSNYTDNSGRLRILVEEVGRWPSPEKPAEVVISYIHFVGAEKRSQGDEYIELKNIGGAAQDIGGWRVEAGDDAQEYAFAAGTTLEPGAALRIYTNRDGEHSFDSKTALWNDGGDLGTLLDASGTLVSKRGYKSAETRTVEGITATYGVESMAVRYEEAKPAEQVRKSDKVDLLTALERAIRSLLHDPPDQQRPNAASRVRDLGGVPAGASPDVLRGLLRDHMNRSTLRLLGADEPGLSELGVDTKDHWVFLLEEGIGGGRHAVVVDRSGTEAAYQVMTT